MSGQNKTRVMIVDDHIVVREGYRGACWRTQASSRSSDMPVTARIGRRSGPGTQTGCRNNGHTDACEKRHRRLP